jgi:hypothetical protein
MYWNVLSLSMFHVFCVLFTHYTDDTAGFQHMQWTLTSTVNLFIEMVWKREACRCTWQYLFNTLKNFLYIMSLMKMDAFPLDNTELADKWITMKFSGDVIRLLAYSHSCTWFNIICFKIPHYEKLMFTWHCGCFAFYVWWQ